MVVIKILIIGPVASGKTTLARRLSLENGIDYYEIDSIVHDDDNKIKRSNNEQQQIIKQINEKDNWIIEGTLRKNLYNLLDEAMKIIYIDIPVSVRKRRILVRFFKQKIGLEKCNYKPNFNMLRMMYLWTKEFEVGKKVFEEQLNRYDKKIVKLDSDYKVKKYSL